MKLEFYLTMAIIVLALAFTGPKRIAQAQGSGFRSTQIFVNGIEVVPINNRIDIVTVGSPVHASVSDNTVVISVDK